MIVFILYAIFFLSCIVLVTTILLQPGKADAGALFTSNISSTAFTPRGTQSVLSRITIGAAAVFMLTALMLSMPALTGNVSVLQTTSGTTTAPIPAQPDTTTNLNTSVQPETGTANASQPTAATPSADINANK